MDFESVVQRVTCIHVDRHTELLGIRDESWTINLACNNWMNPVASFNEEL